MRLFKKGDLLKCTSRSSFKELVVGEKYIATKNQRESTIWVKRAESSDLPKRYPAWLFVIANLQRPPTLAPAGLTSSPVLEKEPAIKRPGGEYLVRYAGVWEICRAAVFSIPPNKNAKCQPTPDHDGNVPVLAWAKRDGSFFADAEMPEDVVALPD